MKFEKTEVYNFLGALRGMRNPLESWHKNDTFIDKVWCSESESYVEQVIMGKNDLQLAQKLIIAGSDHCKFLRQIMVSVDITAPQYFINELATYKVGTTMNSTSMQHTLHKTPISVNMFTFDDERVYEALTDSPPIKDVATANMEHSFETGLHNSDTFRKRYLSFKNGLKLSVTERHKIRGLYSEGMSQTDIAKQFPLKQAAISEIVRNKNCSDTMFFEHCMLIEDWLDRLEELRLLYNETNDYEVFRTLRQLMPMGYNYKFTWTANYQNIRNMYFQRRHHKLTEWSVNFVNWVNTLPYASELITIEKGG